jgi:hypothetical protein
VIQTIPGGLPDAYHDAVMEHEKVNKQWHQLVKDSKLTREQRAQLQSFVEASFQVWTHASLAFYFYSTLYCGVVMLHRVVSLTMYICQIGSTHERKQCSFPTLNKIPAAIQSPLQIGVKPSWNAVHLSFDYTL